MDDVAAIKRNTIAPQTRKAFRNASALFLVWLAQHHSSELAPGFVQELDLSKSKRQLREQVKEALKKEITPINFESFKPDLFMKFLLSLAKKNGERLSISGYSTYRSALFNLFRDHNEEWTPTLQS